MFVVPDVSVEGVVDEDPEVDESVDELPDWLGSVDELSVVPLLSVDAEPLVSEELAWFWKYAQSVLNLIAPRLKTVKSV